MMAQDEVGEAKGVGEEDGHQNDVKRALPSQRAAGGILLGANGGVEGLEFGLIPLPGLAVDV